MAYPAEIHRTARRLCIDAMLLGTALLLSYLEAILPLTLWIPLPGFKLGLCNIVITVAFAALSPRDAAAISFCRILLMGLLFGNAMSLLFSLCGGLLAYGGLWLFARAGKRCFSMIGVSVGCAALHNIGQLLAAASLFGIDVILGYLPLLLLAALIFGTVTGVILEMFLPRFEAVKRSFLKENEKKIV